MDKEMTPRFLSLKFILYFCLYGLLASCGREQETQQPVDAGPAVDVSALENQVAALETRAQRLKDINAIKRLQRAYGYYLDNAMWDEVVDLMSDDSTFEIALDGIYRGRESIRKYLNALSGGKSGLQAGMLNEHMQLQPVIDVAVDGNSAMGRWRALIMAGKWGETATWGEGPYENTYVRENGIWKIKSTHWYETFMVPYHGGWAVERDTLHDGKFASDQVPPDAPSSENYDVWPGVYLPPYHYKNPVTGQDGQVSHE